MSYLHPVQRSYSPSYPSHSLNGRQPSTTSSSASSAYTNSSRSSAFDLSRTSTLTSNSSSAYQYSSPKRGGSETPMAPSAISDMYGSRPRSHEASPETTYRSARQSLRPLPQPPSATPSPKTLKGHAHSRGQSVDVARTFYEDPFTPATKTTQVAARPNSMIFSRSDSIRGVSLRSQGHPNSLPHSPLAAPDFQSMQKSSTKHLRTLSRFAEAANVDEFALTSPEQEVVGLHGRLRLQRNDTSSGRPVTAGGNSGYGWAGRNWMDAKRQFLQAYEYLCHIGEAKQWIEDVICRPIPPIVQLEEALRDGVTLAEVVEALNPGRRIRIFRHPRLQYRHSDNIAVFFRYLDEVELPDVFRFELIDLYEKKNIPKVIYCIHALSFVLYRRGIVNFRIDNLVGQLEFEAHELEAMQKDLDKSGVHMPSFGNIGADFGMEPPEPVETEEERVDRELKENEGSVIDLQAQARGALLRLQLGDTMQWLWNNEHKIVELQSLIRGDFSRQIVEYRLNMRRFAVNLQSACRGFLVRQRQVDTERFWKQREADVLMLQSLIRAKRVQDEVRQMRSELRSESAAIVGLQAAVKGFLARQAFHEQRQETAHNSGAINRLQAAMRGILVRNRLADDMDALMEQEPAVVALQAIARAMLTRDQICRQQEALQRCAPIWRAMQALIRGRATRQAIATTKRALKAESQGITQLQAMARAAALRGEVAAIIAELEAEAESIESAEAAIRGMLLRSRISAEREALEAESTNITQLQSSIRGFLYRRANEKFLASLEQHTAEVTELQALVRAMLLRDEVGALLAELDAEEESVIAFQTAARACLLRSRFEEKKRFFKSNMEKIVKIQSFVRGKLQGEAYKGLMTGKNPPVNTVKNFVHLLNDSDFDFNEEIEFERLRKTVVQQVRQNEMSEQYNDQLDIKIALLVKNKITLDEVVRHQKNFGGHTGNLLGNTSMSSINSFDLKALNKNSRKKLESYQELFFNLQTQPHYLARLFRRVREQGMAEKECKKIEHLMMGLFGYAQKRREEYYLLKLVSRSIKEEIEASASIQDYLRGNFFWSKLMGNYTRSPRDRKYLRDLLGPLIRESIMDDPELDLESDPMQIYRSAINNEELRTGQPSRRPLDVSRELAIKDKETRDLFTEHLRDLREITDQVLTTFEELMPRVPYGMRFVAVQIFESLCERFPREPQDKLLQIVGNWFWRFYLQPALTAPEQIGVIDRQLTHLQKRNLSEVSKVLSQIATGRLFGGDNIFLQPLNAFVGESIERLHAIMSEVIDVPDAESTFDIDEFNDLYSTTKPTLYIKLADIFAIHNLVATELQFICPNKDDILREIVQELGSAKNNETEMMGVTSTEIQLNLTPKLHDVEDPEAEIKALFMETKRCILYIIRVQSGPNLIDILVKRVTEEDEAKWRNLLREDFTAGNNSRGAYSDANTMVDITSMTYFELKRTALQNVLWLEKAGRISKHNFYQDILNAIALDIRTKSKRRIQRQRELEGVRMTLANLHEKAVWLDQQRKAFDHYIEQAMITLQKQKGKKRFLMPFTKQYNHERELQRSGRIPKFGSFKYSAKTLADKGVLVHWQGYNERQYDKINITISSDEVGVFFIEGSMGSIQIPGASAQIPMDDLLQAQFNNLQFMTLFEGGLKLNVNIFLHLLYKKFYRTE